MFTLSPLRRFQAVTTPLAATLPHTPIWNATGRATACPIHTSTQSSSRTAIPAFIQNTRALRLALGRLKVYTPSKYLHDHFTHWVSAYACHSASAAKPLTPLHRYFAGQLELNPVCQDFIKFCFSNGIVLDKDKTLQSFAQHNELADNAVKKELIKFKRRDTVNLLGFGLGDGHYENGIAQHMLNQGMAKSVKIYGFDPFAEKGEGIDYLTPAQLTAHDAPLFDVITARWVLHHVSLQNRWTDFISCVNRSKPNTQVLIVEHGFMQSSVSPLHRKLCHFLNATFDVVANVGIRPYWFTSTAPDIGANFFIHYLQPEDFATIKSKVTVQVVQDIYDIGPKFPHQTICSMQVQPQSNVPTAKL